MNIPIVVVAFNRPDCLLRLFRSLERAKYEMPVKLIVSIDGGGAQEVVSLAQSFEWPYGEKEVILHSKNIGLRENVIFCGSLSCDYDGVILLEDDLVVSPYFYSYAQDVACFYKNDNRIAGIALYSPRYSETAMLPFLPYDDGKDVYFMQLACSWGQCWLKKHWQGFIAWYNVNCGLDLFVDKTLPPDVALWPLTSWKKYYIKYMIEKDKYFVYPRTSYSTNFGDAGQHHKGSNVFQVPLRVGYSKNSKVKFDESFIKYDAFNEMNQECLKAMCPELEGYDICVDLYGYKNLDWVKNEYVLTIKDAEKKEKTFLRKLKPHEANVIFDMHGDEIFLAKKCDVKNMQNFIQERVDRISDWVNVQSYYYYLTERHYTLFNIEISNRERIIASTKEIIEVQHEKLHTAYMYQEELLKEIKAIRNSKTFKLGKALLSPLRSLRKLIEF